MHKRTPTKSGGRKPAVGMRNTFAQTHSAVVRRTADGVCADCRCIRVSSCHGGLTPPALVLQCANVCRRKNDFCDAQTHGAHKERRASEPAVGLVTQLQRRSCTDGRRIAPVRQLRCCCYKRVSETTAGLRQPLLVARTHTAVDARLRPATALCSPRGTNAPLLCCSANVCRRKNDFCDAQTHAHKERRASARRGVANARAAESEFVAHNERRDQERRASARRGVRNRTCKGNTAKSRETVTDGLVNVIAITVA
jgi:hypothetical protein